MSAGNEERAVVAGRGVRKTFRRGRSEVVRALDVIALDVRPASLTALVGPDGAGKTTLLRLITGLLEADGGELRVLGLDAATQASELQTRLGYMPQRFGLYEDLSVQENLDLYADLHGVPAARRAEHYARLMEMTALGPFRQRLAGRLSGGMKQKLGLACTLVRSPELLVLDEPTVGVDPLSRRELWQIIRHLVEAERLTVLLATSYLDEAERCDEVVVLHEGRVLKQGKPADTSGLAAERTFVLEPPVGVSARRLQARLLDDPAVVDAVPEGGRVRIVRAADEPAAAVSRAGVDFAGDIGDVGAGRAVPPRFEDGFMVLLHERTNGKAVSPAARLEPGYTHVPAKSDDEAVVVVRDLGRRFGNFVAVDRVSFEVRRGEIFGLLGPNGAGKTTTFRMLCGLLPASEGTLRVAGVDVRTARASARQRLGYVAQKFSLYGQLSVRENLEFFASAYSLRGGRRRQRVQWAVEHFELGRLLELPAEKLPGGYKQRLAMAAALLHEPDILFLDEPTSGADPLARREFWRRITALADRGVTVIVTTHFMAEAEYCTRIAIMDAGRLLAQGTPAEIRRRGSGERGREPTMEDAFVAIVQAARAADDEDAAA